MKTIRKYKRSIALFFTLSLFTQLFFPLAAYAITGSSSMPEYRSFEPVSTTNMVNLFDGSFNYNIPLLDVPNGYPINLSYHSNEVNNEAQASWVGLGWTLNPGSINRAKRGFADDVKNKSVTYHSKMPTNWTVTGGIGGGLRIMGKSGGGLLGVNIGMALRYNNYNGVGNTMTGGLSGPAGIASLNFSYSQGRFGFDPEVNPGAIFELARSKKTGSDPKTKETKDAQPTKTYTEQEKKIATKAESKERSKASLKKGFKGAQFSMSSGGVTVGTGSQFGISSCPPVSFPTTVTRYNGLSTTLRFDLALNVLPAPVGINADATGSYSQQTNEESTDTKVYGYLYNQDALGDKTSMMDYYTENEKMFEKRDKILAVPLPNNDVYSVSGEALGGTFRAFRSEFGHYRKNEVNSETFGFKAGGDFGMALPPSPVTNLEYTFGGNLGGDYHSLKISDWEDAAKDYTFKDNSYFPESDENTFFRFSSDLGGSVDLTNGNDEAYTPTLEKNGLSASVNYGNYGGSAQLSQRSSRSSYISQHTFSDFSALSNGRKYKVYEKNLKVLNANSSNTYTNSDVIDYHSNVGAYEQDGIAEFATYNADGARYVYGLPLHTRKEKSLSYSLNPGSDFSIAEFNDKDGLIATPDLGTNIHDNSKRRLGTESSTAYASQYLLTQIVSPDYTDRTFNGPTPDDFGSYSKFNYTRVAGGSGNWYPFRSPYTGLSYDYGSLSEKHDNMGSYEAGEKELYYIRSICSKTHVAIFTLEDRKDALSPDIVGSLDIHDALIKCNSGNDRMPQKVLKRIDLYSINDCHEIGPAGSGIYEPNTGTTPAVPIKTVNFQYNYSLCNGVPNNDKLDPNTLNQGKLTLEKVWFEYEGKLTSKISPYVFSYKYPTSTEVDYTDKYDNFLTAYGDNGSLVQNPNYDVRNSDRWGNYRDYSGLMTNVGALARFFPFVNQTPSSAFDPAAWCLKRITLPSGGEIHVQYEQNDYKYVQDKRAMVMVPLHTATDTDEDNSNEKKYYLDLSKVGVDLGSLTTDQSKQDLVREMFKPIRSERIFFNFLYKLLGTGNADISTTNAEYIEGYARIQGYGIDDGKAFFVFKSKNITASGGAAFFEQIDYGSKNSKRELPQKVCKEFYKSSRRGKVGESQDAISDESSLESKVLGFATAMAATNRTDICLEMTPAMSFVRLQTPIKKLGGGVRVKRLLMYESGATMSSVPSVYGNEYKYTTQENGVEISSGVATSEPGAGRRESPLCNPIEKDAETGLEAFLYGRDMYSQEGPLGEGLLPSPSIGYSKITVSNIHQSVTSTGHEVHEFYTAHDFPFKADYTTLTELFKTKIGASATTKGGSGGGYSRKNPYMAMGYRFQINEMHGQKKRVAKYGNNPRTPIAEELYEYYAPGESIKVMNEGLGVETLPIGKETEILGESREVADILVGGAFGIEFTAGVWILPATPPLPITLIYLSNVNFNGYVNEQILRTHVTTKIVRYPAILKKVINISDGVKHTTENMIMDKYTGSPIIVKSYDDFEKTYMDQSFMASWSVKNMRPVSLNERLKVAGVFVLGEDATHDYITFSSTSGGCNALDNFVKGDFLELSQGSGTPALYHVSDLDYVNNRLVILKSGLNTRTLTNADINIDIIESGYTNELNAKAGMIKFHNRSDAFSMTPPALDSDIEDFLDLLNTGLHGSGNATINKASIPAGLMLFSPDSNKCKSGPQFADNIYISKTTNSVKVEIGQTHNNGTTTTYPYNAQNLHPMVTDLNNYINSVWRLPILNSLPFASPQLTSYTGNKFTSVPYYYYREYTNHIPSGFSTLRSTLLGKQYQWVSGNPSNIAANTLITLPNYVEGFALSSTENFQNTRVEVQTDLARMRVELTGRDGEGANSAFNDFQAINFTDLTMGYNAYPSNLNIHSKVTQGRAEVLNYLNTPASQFTQKYGYFTLNNQGKLLYKDVFNNLDPVDFGIQFYQVIDNVVLPYCTSLLAHAGPNFASSSFSYNERTGYIMYNDGNGCPQNVLCLKVCPKTPTPQVIDKVVAASAATFSDDWYYNPSNYPGGTTFNLNVYESGLKGKWRGKEQFVFRKPIDENNEDKNFNKGTFTLTAFNWNDLSQNDVNKWVKTSTTTVYSPNGDPLEDKNILDIYSTSKFGYNNTLPVLVAQNASDHTVAFESFEMAPGVTFFDDGLTNTIFAGTIVNSISHTGSACISMKPNASFKIANIKVNNQVTTEGLLVRAWLKSNKIKNILDGKVSLVFGSNNSLLMNKVSGSGEWVLYEGLITPSLLTSANLALTTKPDGNYMGAWIRINDPKSEYVQGDLYMDDIRVQPMQSEMVCYVYDKAQRLLAVMDDQHYALVYEYNSEGMLVRKLKETVKGLKTISETQYNTKGEQR